MITARIMARRVASGLAALLAGTGLVAGSAGAAQAAVPDHWGFAFVSKPKVAGIPDPAHQAGSWPALYKVHTAPAAGKRVIVRFPQIASNAGVVHVTAVTDAAVWCQALKWGPSGANELVAVRCHKAGGAAVFAPFAVTFTQATKGAFPAGRAYGYVRFEPGGIVTQFNSVGATNTVTAGPVGVWTVRMPGLGSSKRIGGVQVTAVSPAAPAKCQLTGWSPVTGAQRFQVRCYNGGTAPMKTGWTLTYQRGRAITGTQPKLFGYTFNDKPTLTTPYSPAPQVNFNSVGLVNTIRKSGSALWLVTFPRLGQTPNNVLVTPFQAPPGGFCNLISVWATASNVIVRDVGCYTAAGAPAKKAASLISYVSAH